MSSKASIENEFIKLRKGIFNIFGKKAMSDDAITRYLKSQIGDKFQGTFPWDVYKPEEGKLAIVNTGSRKSRGVHWTAVYPTKTSTYIYDSFNRPPSTLFPHLVNKLEGSGKNVKMGEVDKQQLERSAICGQNSMAWCLLVAKVGIKLATTV